MHTVGSRIGNWVVDDVVALTEPWLYKAHRHDDPERTAALKVARRGKHDAGFEREAAALRKLDHAAIPKCLDHGQDAEINWLAMPWFEGEALSDRLLSGPLEWREACLAFEKLASALSHVHAANIVHRDVTPAHVRIGSDGAVRLEGFELAMEDAQLDRAADVPLGDLSYVAPEAIAKPDHHAPRADLYAFGCVFYEALTGRTAFPAAAWGAKVDPAARMLEWKTRAEALDPGVDVPSWLAQLVRKATHPAPAKRLPDTDAFLGWLDGARPSWAPAPAPVAPPPPLAPVATLAPVIPAPTLVLAPKLAPPIQVDEPPARPTPTPTMDLRPPAAPSIPAYKPPPPFLYAQATALGVISGLAFSGLVILFVEMTAGG
jgi:serine/threonine protein kinase